MSAFFHEVGRRRSKKEEFKMSATGGLRVQDRLGVQDFATGKNFFFNHRHNKEFWVFLRKVML